ncbi:MAG: type II toxin-antitoxin system PemK/MazF family toxin [Candidatus Omnitrophica bacterium]|nr:type II toxin-antitoxin system PemK/MazF family toxin [Candidatus Omnitrophota bacterium]
MTRCRNIEKFHIYLADLEPGIGTEPGKVRPVVVVQSDLLNGRHLSTIICPLTTNVDLEMRVLRVHLDDKLPGMRNSDIMVDQIRAIDNRRIIKHIGRISRDQAEKLMENLKFLILE